MSGPAPRRLGAWYALRTYMEDGMRHVGQRAGVLAGLFALGWLGAGCAALGGAGAAPSAAPGVEQGARSAPACPASIAEEKPLEMGFRPELEARAWVPGLVPGSLGFAPEARARERFRQTLTLASGPLEVLGLEEGGDPAREEGGAAVVFALPASGGHCVVNSWSTWLSGKVGLSLASAWTAADGRLALLLLKLEVARAEGLETRWVVLGTDGARAWIALGEPPQHQLLVPRVAFFQKGQQVYLDIHQRHVTRLALGRDGRFAVPAASR